MSYEENLKECKTCGTQVASGWLYQGADFYCMNKCIVASIGEDVFRPLWRNWQEMKENPDELTWHLIG